MRHKIAMTCMLGILLLGVAGCGEMKVEEYTQAGMNEIQNYNYDAAMESFDRAEELKEDPMLIARGRGIASYYLMDYDSSVAYYLQSLSYSDSKADELDFDTNFYLADAYEKLDDHQSAVDTYTAILNLHEKDVTAYYLRGIQYLLLGNHDLAVEDFGRALELDENNYDLRIEIAGRLSENNYSEEGVQLLQSLLTEKEKKLSSYDKGRIYYYMSDYDNARVYLEAVRDDDDQNTVLFLGRTYEKLGDFNYAASVYDSFLKRHPDSALIYNQMGLSKLQSKDFEGALNAFMSAKNIENNGMEQTLTYNLIVAYEYNGDFAKAKSLMNSYVAKYPDDSAAAKEHIFLETR